MRRGAFAQRAQPIPDGSRDRQQGSSSQIVRGKRSRQRPGANGDRRRSRRRPRCGIVFTGSARVASSIPPDSASSALFAARIVSRSARHSTRKTISVIASRGAVLVRTFAILLIALARLPPLGHGAFRDVMTDLPQSASCSSWLAPVHLLCGLHPRRRNLSASRHDLGFWTHAHALPSCPWLRSIALYFIRGDAPASRVLASFTMTRASSVAVLPGVRRAAMWSVPVGTTNGVERAICGPPLV